MLGCMLAFLKDRLDNRVQSANQIERTLGLSVLGLLPRLSNRRAKRWPGRYIAERPFSSFAEAARSIVTGVRTHRHGSAAPVMLVTSALPHEGKTTLAISLAAAAASSGLKTLLIDLDLRCPSLDDRLADTIELPGLVDHLKGQLQRSQLIQRDDGSGIDYVVVGEPPHNPLELLQSPQLRHLIETWRREYDQVFIDSAPVLAVTDTRVTVGLADRVLLAAMWQETDLDAVTHAVRSLLEVGGEVAGVVLTSVNMKRYKLYARGEAGSYYKRYRRYYLE
jgi:capsular exopolysaccharide synthesis family protein